MANQWCNKAAFCNQLFCARNAVRQRRDRYAAVCHHPLTSLAQRFSSVIGSVARLPKAVALLRFRGPAEPRYAKVISDRLKLLHLFSYPGVGSMKFEKKVRFLGHVHIWIIGVHPAHLDLVQKFNPRHGQTNLDGKDHRLNSLFDGLKGTGCR